MGSIATHCSAAELGSLIAAADAVCDENSRKLTTTTWSGRRAG
jgi:hypothetical protein